jgi:hypothetical protein
MCYAGTTCSASRMDDHGQDQSEVNSEVSRWLAPCSALMTTYTRQSRKLAFKELRDSSSIYSTGWRYTQLVDHTSCFPISTFEDFRMNHPSRANAKSEIHRSRLSDSTHSTLSQAHRMVLGSGTLTKRYRIPAMIAYDFMLLKLENRVTNTNLTPLLVNAVGSNPVNRW